MKLFYPVDKKWTITQKFGENIHNYPKREGHPGIDYGCPVGSPLYACIDGKIESAGYNEANGYGRMISIRSGDWLFIYGHCLELYVRYGDRVTAGQKIACSGGEITDPQRGMSSGPHLHFEMRDMTKPQTYPLIGAVDPEPYLNPSNSTGLEGMVQVVTENLNIRLAPKLDGKLVGRLERGTYLKTAGDPIDDWQPVIVYVKRSLNGDPYIK